MSHDTFISHSSDDKIIADAVTAALEQANIRCWIAPRDIRPGDSWGGAIVKAIESSRVMVVIFSAKSNDSKQVMREVERAVQHDVVVVPFRIEDVQPTRDMEYFLSSTHWLDAMSPEMDNHLQELTKTIANILEKPVDDKATVKASKRAAATLGKSKPTKAPASSSNLTTILGGVMAVLVLGLAALYFFGGDEGDSPKEQTRAQDLDSRETGDVKLKADDEVRAGGKLEVKWSGDTADNDYIVIVPHDAAESVTSGRQNLKGNPLLTFEVPDKPGDYEVRYIDAANRSVIARHELEITQPGVTLDGPDEGIAGSKIKVSWTAPNDRSDYLSIAKPGAEDRAYEAYSYTAKGSPTELRLPDVAGEYQLRYVSGGGNVVWARSTIEVKKPEVSLELASTQEAGAEILVDWQGPANQSDYLTVADPQMGGKEYFSYSYVRAGKKTKLRLPADGGEYEVRYVSGQAGEIWGRETITVEKPDVRLDVPDQAATGNTLRMDWEGPANKGDYVTVAEPGSEAGNQYVSYKYIKKNRPAEIQMPEEPGDYLIRYVSAANNTTWFEQAITVTQRSESITAASEVKAGERFTVNWQNKGDNGQYIGVYPADSSDDASSVSYVYTKGKTQAKINAPREPGNYQLRYISGSKKQVWARAALTVVADE